LDLKFLINALKIRTFYLVSEDYKDIDLTKTLFKITKTFLFNDFELLNFSIYLEKLSWDHKSFNLEDFLFVLGLSVKIKLSEPSYQSFCVENLKMENPEFYLKYMQWHSENKIFSQIKITEKDLNSKYKALSKVKNFIFKQNYPVKVKF